MAYEIRRFPYDGTVDADGHILEPPDLWENYLPEKYLDKALRIGVDEEGYEYLEWVLVDYVNIVVHIFIKDAREYYELERLWADGNITKVQDKK